MVRFHHRLFHPLNKGKKPVMRGTAPNQSLLWQIDLAQLIDQSPLMVAVSFVQSQLLSISDVASLLLTNIVGKLQLPTFTGILPRGRRRRQKLEFHWG
jgi:hypothetical protein